jgi:hypothetical protein
MEKRVLGDDIDAAPSSKLGVSAAYVHYFMENHDIANMKTWQLKENFVLPTLKTAERKCPFVEYLASHDEEMMRSFVGKATVFVSHAYSYALSDTFEVTLLFCFFVRPKIWKHPCCV